MISDKRRFKGPFDIIGDVHGAADEFRDMLHKLGYMDDYGNVKRHSEGRTVITLGDLIDRGPKNIECLNIAKSLTEIGGLAVIGNHDDRLRRWFKGNDVDISKGFRITLDEIMTAPSHWCQDIYMWLSGLPPHLVLDGGQLVVAHAGLPERYQGDSSRKSRDYALYGPDKNWALQYRGSAMVVQGHNVHPKPSVLNNVIRIDTGLVFGGSLTALRWPEMTFESVKARREYFNPDGRDILREG